MKNLLAELMVVALAAALMPAPAQAAPAGEAKVSAAPAAWPMYHGPDGNFVPPRSGVPLVDDLAEARLVWESEDRDLGCAKSAVSGWPFYFAAAERGHPGSCSGPIVAEGKVFYTSFRPSGDVVPADVEEAFQKAGRTLPREKYLIAADDVVGAIDLATGKTAWKAVEAGKGLSRPQIKRQGYGVAPAYAKGKVFSLGTTGRLYAYDAATGARRWETTIGKTHEHMEQLKKELLEARRVAPRMPWLSSLVVAEGVLVVPLFDGLAMGLRGVDVESGRTLWEAPRVISSWATPALFRHEGREYLLAATVGGELRMIDPRDGKALWTVTGLGPNHFTLAPSDKHVLVNVGTKAPRAEEGKHTQTYWGLLGAYRIGPQGAERAWTMPDKQAYYFETWFDTAAMRKYVIRDGLVYYYSRGPKADEGGRPEAHFLVLREATGQVLLDTQDGPTRGMLMLCEDRLVSVPDASHSDRLTMEMYTADPRDFRRLGTEWKPPHQSTTAYEVFMEIPYVDGRIFMRTEQGTLRCYDLRKAK